MSPSLREELSAILKEATVSPDDLAKARTLLQEAAAIQEMASRVSGDNEEDFDMLQRAASVTLRVLEEASALLKGARVQ